MPIDDIPVSRRPCASLSSGAMHKGFAVFSSAPLFALFFARVGSVCLRTAHHTFAPPPTNMTHAAPVFRRLTRPLFARPLAAADPPPLLARLSARRDRASVAAAGPAPPPPLLAPGTSLTEFRASSATTPRLAHRHGRRPSFTPVDNNEGITDLWSASRLGAVFVTSRHTITFTHPAHSPGVFFTWDLPMSFAIYDAWCRKASIKYTGNIYLIAKKRISPIYLTEEVFQHYKRMRATDEAFKKKSERDERQ
ncbi:hypothetical protein Scep_001492 [Stephania cephalantha]|uniref:Uncharacterized protein n=1 Tax=Stephania cephalantha TaxID=152367 RepID=A0AAP0Q7S8_9MAGN